METKFKFSGRGDITSLNTRKEGPDEDKVLAVDVKLSANVHIDDVVCFEPAIKDFCFLDSGAVRNLMIGPIAFSNELKHYRLDIAGSSHFGVSVKKITVEPKDGYRARLNCQISFKPSGDEIATLAECLQDEIRFALEPENGELDFDGSDEPKSAKASPKVPKIEPWPYPTKVKTKSGESPNLHGVYDLMADEELVWESKKNNIKIFLTELENNRWMCSYSITLGTEHSSSPMTAKDTFESRAEALSGAEAMLYSFNYHKKLKGKDATGIIQFMGKLLDEAGHAPRNTW